MGNSPQIAAISSRENLRLNDLLVALLYPSAIFSPASRRALPANLLFRARWYPNRDVAMWQQSGVHPLVQQMEEKMSKSPAEKESYGPEASLRILEAMGLGDGPLAKAFRRALESPSIGALVVTSVCIEPDPSTERSKRQAAKKRSG